MRRLLLILMLFCSCVVWAAEFTPAEKPPEKKPARKAVQDDAKRPDSKKKSSPQWPRPYQATEEISVDTIVPFPIDI